MLNSIALSDISIDDSFWSRYTGLIRSEIIPYQWAVMNDRLPDVERSHCIENLKIAAGLAEGDFYGFVFQDSDLAKWLETVAYSLAVYPDEELEKIADEAIDLICLAQQEDGYLNSYFTIKHPGIKWGNLKEGHELYTAGHMMEAAVAYFEVTGKRKFLEAMMRFADLICDTFGSEQGKLPGFPGHQEIELALVKMYKATGVRKYLMMAAHFINIRGVGDNYFKIEARCPDYPVIWSKPNGEFDWSYYQSHLPVREQKSAAGHAVRAVYMYCGMVDIARELNDNSLFDACEALWENITKKQMYVTGGIGSSGTLERFTTDYDLSNDYAYAESCASIGLALFGLRMNQISGNSKYMDVVESALYNTVAASIALDGKSFFYVNPLEVWPNSCMPHTSKSHVSPTRKKWFACACCPPNIARTLASLGQYIWSQGVGRIFINLFVNSSVSTKCGAKITLETTFPRENYIKLSSTKRVEVAVRIPEYAKNYSVGVPYDVKNGYALFTLEGSVDVSFDAPAHFVWGNPKLRSASGKVCVQRGPLVFCLEQVDNGENLSAISIDTEKPLTEISGSDVPGGLLIEGMGKRSKLWQDDELYKNESAKYEDVRLRFVPYAFWGNRVPGEMAVWIREL